MNGKLSGTITSRVLVVLLVVPVSGACHRPWTNHPFCPRGMDSVTSKVPEVDGEALLDYNYLEFEILLITL